MQLEVLAPAAMVALAYPVRSLLTKDWAEEVRKALFCGAILMSVALGLDVKYVLTYWAFAVLSATEGREVYAALFSGLLAYVSYIMTNPLFSVVPIAITGIAAPLAYFINRTIWRSEKGGWWVVNMFAISSAMAAGLVVSLEALNPAWGLLIGAVATWAARVDDSFALPLFSFVAVGYVYAPLAGTVAGFGFSLIASSFAYYLQALDLNGLVAGVVLGSLIYGASPLLFVTLLAFMVSSSLIGRFSRHDPRFQVKGKRNAMQVLSNAFGACLAAAFMLAGNDVVGLGIAAIAAATADTWATEIGSLSRRKPRMITTLKVVEKGQSGGVTPLGLGASLLAGLFVFAVTYPFAGMTYLVHSVAGGALGSLIDSVLGATVQGIFRCRVCSKLTEHQKHCSKSTLLERGMWWFNNDLVNLAATVAAMVVVI
jgi:uncharacterized protein (TIGR00297 family)